MKRNYRIPFIPPLAAGTLFGRRHPFEAALGCEADRVRYYYLARNALWHGVGALGLKPGDTVLMPAYHHGVEVETLLHRELRLRYYRIDGGMRIDMEDLLAQATPDVRALYVIHYLGFPQPIAELADLARRRGWRLIEDCALSLFSRAPEGPLGRFGGISIYCLYKSLPVPHGGMLCVNDTAAPVPGEAIAPDRFSTSVYLAHRFLEHYELAASGWGGDRGIALLRGAARAAKGASGARVVPIDTEHFEPSQRDLGIAPVCRRILGGVDAAGIVERRRANFLALAGALRPGIRAVTRDLPPGVCPLSLPILVREKPETQERLAAVGVGTVNFWSKSRPDVSWERFPEVVELRRHVLELPVHQGLSTRHIEYVAFQANRIAAW
jgi:hypothetical protein